MPLAMLRVAIYARPDREDALLTAREAYRRLSELGAEPLYEASIAGLLGGPGVDLRFTPVDAVVVIGGDGTLLRLLQLLGDRSPILHLVKVARRGFLFEDIPPEESLRLLERLVSGDYWVEELSRLRVTAPGYNGSALNEAAVLALGSKVAGLRVEAGGMVLYKGLEGDGIIASTPTGSSAYNYSAGGPVLHPLLRATVLTPVNPLDRRMGSLVLPGDMEVSILVERTTRPVKLIIDGVQERLLHRGALVKVSLTAPPARVARYREREPRPRLPWLPGYTF